MRRNLLRGSRQRQPQSAGQQLGRQAPRSLRHSPQCRLWNMLPEPSGSTSERLKVQKVTRFIIDLSRKTYLGEAEGHHLGLLQGEAPVEQAAEVHVHDLPRLCVHQDVLPCSHDTHTSIHQMKYSSALLHCLWMSGFGTAHLIVIGRCYITRKCGQSVCHEQQTSCHRHTHHGRPPLLLIHTMYRSVPSRPGRLLTTGLPCCVHEEHTKQVWPRPEDDTASGCTLGSKQESPFSFSESDSAPWRSPRPQTWPTMDMTAAVRVKASRAACHAAGSAQRLRNQRCMRGGSIASTRSSSLLRRLSCSEGRGGWQPGAASPGLTRQKCIWGAALERAGDACAAAASPTQESNSSLRPLPWCECDCPGVKLTFLWQIPATFPSRVSKVHGQLVRPAGSHREEPSWASRASLCNQMLCICSGRGALCNDLAQGPRIRPRSSSAGGSMQRPAVRTSGLKPRVKSDAVLLGMLGAPWARCRTACGSGCGSLWNRGQD